MALNPRFAADIDANADLYDEGGFPDEDFFADGVDPWEEMGEPAYDNFNVAEAVQELGESGQPAGYLSVAPDGEYDASRAQPDGDDDGYLAVNPEWLEEQWKLLSVQPWFRGAQSYTRHDATTELAQAEPGTFVVRISQSQPGHYAISAKTTANKIVSMLILPSWAGADSTAPGHTQYRLGTASTLLFNTVPRLIKYYTENNYYMGERLKGEVVPEQQEGGYMLLAPTQ
ncbi:hypothetical protein PTSG_05752 [Salpingoeca rosetta]|uniref:SH2 domain-containing protein n=1 Tax=Salpingoeca rosetta (strain ATCC 50818 / BSB-021) TaxID=946362 RepID=F2UB47_SALR5|nr:uncharacterized protein PTSG_05752 [Salpingoeca rosetta]EGD74060.1 hypothetical protein PTSG_05752 [Salpingoeca rosetta]|eukprot:XP_004993622.1 hypothetical protein PTSG_05752 [Salpingoeca rosetta]